MKNQEQRRKITLEASWVIDEICNDLTAETLAEHVPRLRKLACIIMSAADDETDTPSQMIERLDAVAPERFVIP